MQIHCRYDELVSPLKLKPSPRNPNRHTTDQSLRLSKLYEYHGIRHPIIVSKNSGYIVAGHARHQAALLAELKEFPVVYQEFKDDDAEYAFMVADNAIADWADLDLSAINKELGDLGPDFDVAMLGIEKFTLDANFEPGTEDEQGQLDQKKPIECPHCGVSFTP